MSQDLYRCNSYEDAEEIAARRSERALEAEVRRLQSSPALLSEVVDDYLADGQSTSFSQAIAIIALGQGTGIDYKESAVEAVARIIGEHLRKYARFNYHETSAEEIWEAAQRSRAEHRFEALREAA